MKNITKILLLLIGLTLTLNAATTSGGYGACISEEYYKEWNSADTNGMQYLVNSNKCFILKSGLEYSMVDRGWMSSVIRVYIGGNGIKLWTANENIR